MIRTIYGFDDLGRKVPTGSYDDGYNPVGGRIFYINSKSDETVKFYDSSFNELSNIAVGDTPAYYKVTSAGVSGKEKYYVYNDAVNTKIWGYRSITIDVFGGSLGMGKSNTKTIMGTLDTSGANNTAWTYIKLINENLLNNCSDWYVGTTSELTYLKNYLDANADGEVIINYFTDIKVWSSVANSYYNWESQYYNGNCVDRDSAGRVIPIRSF